MQLKPHICKNLIGWTNNHVEMKLYTQIFNVKYTSSYTMKTLSVHINTKQSMQLLMNETQLVWFSNDKTINKLFIIRQKDFGHLFQEIRFSQQGMSFVKLLRFNQYIQCLRIWLNLAQLKFCTLIIFFFRWYFIQSKTD